jgi:hypothetical protein
MKRVTVALAMACLLCGCARGHSDWFRIYEARAAVDALQQDSAAGIEPGEVERVSALLDRAETALAEGRGDEVAQIAELALLRAHIARVGAAAGRAEEDASEAETALSAATQSADDEQRRLRDAKADLEALNER